MKKVLGLDLGTTSIGWALVNEADKEQEKSSIIKLGVRVIQYDNFTNPEGKELKGNPADFFALGKSVTPNAARRQSRSMRRNLQRYKLRRSVLIETLREYGWITEETILNEIGSFSTYQTINLRAKAATAAVSLEEFARILLNINKKRGYKSNRKLKDAGEGEIVSSIDIAKELYEKDLTPGQFVLERIKRNEFDIPDFYRSDLQNEFDKIWSVQKAFYPNELSENLKGSLAEKNKKQTWMECQKSWNLQGIKREFKGKELLKENYLWRAQALSDKLDLEQLVVVLQEINAQIKKSSGYLGNISDRSKELQFKHITVGQYQAAQIQLNPHYSLKNTVFFRQDYLDEFERLWEMQSKYHPELTDEKKKYLRDIVIFYQRPLKSQKGLLSLCEFESWDAEVQSDDGRTRLKRIGQRVCPKSSPLFQDFKIWQRLNDLRVNGLLLDQNQKSILFRELSIRGNLSAKECLKVLYPKAAAGKSLNFKDIDGNTTQKRLYEAYSKILSNKGYGDYDFSQMRAEDTLKVVHDAFSELGYNTDFLSLDSSSGNLESQTLYKIWHLLYSFEGDKSVSGIDNLVRKLQEITLMDENSARLLASVSFASEYGSLSSRAIKRILPHLKDGYEYSEACVLAGYRHSIKSLTKDEIEKKEYKDRIDLLPNHSLRNPVVEKILNQMINVVNCVIDTYGKPDEVRIELSRELKKSATERAEMSEEIAKATRAREEYKSILEKEFNISNPSRNDIVRYRLYKELEKNGYKTLYSNTYIPQEKLFSKEFDIEHIIPQAKLFDDSFANKTLESRQVNIEKSKSTAYDFIENKYGEEAAQTYRERVERLFQGGSISKKKMLNLLMTERDIPQGFIERDLRETQYIAKKSKEILENVVKSVVSTTGSVTDRLREDWQLIDLMKELNWDKYDKLGLTEIEVRKDGSRDYKIKGWTKRNDHRHHAMDALTIAFTKRSYIQYLNNLNARIEKSLDDVPLVNLDDYDLTDLSPEDRTRVVMAIQKREMYRDHHKRLRFNPPMPLNEFREAAKSHLNDILISIKPSGRVATRNVNISKRRGGVNKKVQLTPRGQLHNETYYGHIQRPVIKLEKVGPSFSFEKIQDVASPVYKAALEKRLVEYGGDAKKAFGGKNGIQKNPIYIDDLHTVCVPERVKMVRYEDVYTKRTAISPDIKLDKVIDNGIKRILQRRLEEYGGDAKLAFSNLEENPIWLNKEKGISIKSVTITGKSDVKPIYSKRDNSGRFILDKDGKKLPNGFISTGSNHHIAIYEDADGNLQENVVSFLEAVIRVNDEQPVVDYNYNRDAGWKLLYTMKRNEYFVFPNSKTGFNPEEIDLMDPKNYAEISPNLYRVQKLASKYYVFRHHLETVLGDDDSLRDITWKRIQSVNNMKGVVKVRVNHLGHIVHVGE